MGISRAVRYRVGRLVAVEGIDASGKSSLAQAMVANLDDRGIPAVVVSRATVPRLLSGYPASHLDTLASLIWDYPDDAHTSELGFWHWAKLLGAWYSAVDHLIVRPGIGTGAIMIADSWIYKYVARFALDLGLVDALNCFSEVSEPDRVVWIDIAPELCAQRRSNLRATERGEWIGRSGGVADFVEYQHRVRAQFASLAARKIWQSVISVDPPTIMGQRVCDELIKDWPIA
jgi:thymidylate kinase